jgi:hypothetical protein
LPDEFGDVAGGDEHFEGVVDVAFVLAEKLVADVEEHDDDSLDIFQLAVHDADGLLLLEEAVVAFLLEADAAFGLLLDAVQQLFLLLLQETHHLVREDEFALHFALCVV